MPTRPVARHPLFWLLAESGVAPASWGTSVPADSVMLGALSLPRVFRRCRRRAGRWNPGFALACACVGVACAQEPDFHQRAWTTDDGLPHNSVSAVVQDHEGYIWLATVGGLARFDGREFRALRPPAEFRARGFNIRGLAEESHGTLVVLGTGRNLLRLTGTTWSLHPINATLAEVPGTPMDVTTGATLAFTIVPAWWEKTAFAWARWSC